MFFPPLCHSRPFSYLIFVAKLFGVQRSLYNGLFGLVLLGPCVVSEHLYLCAEAMWITKPGGVLHISPAFFLNSFIFDKKNKK